MVLLRLSRPLAFLDNCYFSPWLGADGQVIGREDSPIGDGQTVIQPEHPAGESPPQDKKGVIL
jgi:hypothetical protein